MALILGLHQGEDFYVGDVRVKLIEIYSPMQFQLGIQHGPHQRQVFEISDEASTEILPQVRVSAGKPTMDGQVKALIEAPRNIAIARGGLYRKATHEKGKVFK